MPWTISAKQPSKERIEPGCTVRRNREPLAVNLQFEVLLDEPEIGRIVRVGNWILTTYPDGHGEWEYEGAKHEPKAAARQPREIRRSDQPGEVAENLREASANGALRRAALPRVPSRARVQESHSWDALLKPDKAS